MAVQLAFAGDVSDGVLFCALLFLTGCLGFRSISENVSSYFWPILNVALV